MAGMGPPPKPDDQRRRRNATVAMTRLPAEGRTKPCPRWPLVPDVELTVRRRLAESAVDRLQFQRDELLEAGKSVAAMERRIDAALAAFEIADAQLAGQAGLEAELWADLWRLPQAVEWERLGWLRDVAQYVRHKAKGELGDLDAAKEARQWSDRLGLSPLAMLRLRWAIVEDEVGARRDEKEQGEARSAKPRLRVVDPGAVAG
jgi:hypothetical protein